MSGDHVHRFTSRFKQIVAMQVAINYAYGDRSNPGNANDHNQAFNVEDIISDEKCYCPCTQCRGMKRRRLVRETFRKHFSQYGHMEGGT